VIIAIMLGFIGHGMDAVIDDMLPVESGRGVNLLARYSVGYLLALVAFAWLTNDMPEPYRTKARQLMGLAGGCVGVGVGVRRVIGAFGGGD